MESTTPPTTPPGGDQPLPPPAVPRPRPAPRTPGDDGFFDSVRRVGLVRTQDRWIGGVAGGLARRFGIDPLLVRGVLGITVLLGGAGLVVYGLAWALLPEEVDGRIHLQETVQGRFDAAILGALAFVIVGANRGAGWNGWWDDNGFGWVNGLLWLAAIAAIVAIVVSAANQRSRGRAAAGAATTWSAAAPPPPGGSRTVPHPGYGAVPMASPAPSTWSAAPASHVPPPPGATRAAGAPMGGGSGATAYRPQQAYVPPQPPVPPRPPKPRVLGPGVGMVGTVVGLTLLALAALLVAEREGELGQPVALTALGIGIVLAGLGILVSGLRGRSSGVLGFLAVVGILAAVPVALTYGADGRFGFADDRFGFVDGRHQVPSGETWTPTTAAEASEGISVGFGDLRVDLTEVPLDDDVVEVPISMSAGDLEVVVPEDIAVTGEVSLTAGQIRWDVDGTSQVAGFSGGRAELYESDEVADGDVDLTIRITAGAGDVRVVEEDR